MSASSYLLFSPASDQACVFARYLSQYKSEIPIIGMFLPGEPISFYYRYLKKNIVFDVQRFCEINGCYFPTGALSTKYLLENVGDITLGQITLTKDALRVFDKIWLLHFAKEINITVPRTSRLYSDIHQYPLFYKQSYECGGGVRGIAHSEQDLPLQNDQLIYQEFINGAGTYGVGIDRKSTRLNSSHT